MRTKTPEELASLAAGSVSPIEAETVGELLARRGRSFALVSSGSAGAARLLHPQAERLGQFRWSPDDPGCRGPGLEARFGPPPPPALPNLGRIAHAGRVFVEHVLAELEPDVALLWLSEPDFSFHYAGLGSPVAREALRAADAELGRVMAWRDGQPDRERIVLVAFSDHGHATGTRRVSVVQALNAAGFRAGEDGESDIVVAGGGAVGLWLRDQAALPSVAEFLAAQPWVGVLLALAPDRLPAGLALPLSLTGSAHRRSPDLVCTFAGSDAPDPWGLSGTAAFDSADVPESGGMHGGLHRTELGTVTGHGRWPRAPWSEGSGAGATSATSCRPCYTFLGYPAPGWTASRSSPRSTRRKSEGHLRSASASRAATRLTACGTAGAAFTHARQDQRSAADPRVCPSPPTTPERSHDGKPRRWPVEPCRKKSGLLPVWIARAIQGARTGIGR
ncbi:MAG: alkaline phosphatase family protein [Acetobacteraceae bacterium]|nr:alkaline phosphatase family protein [Acetobacteraceae bacterium]